MKHYKFSKSFYIVVLVTVPLVLVWVKNEYHWNTLRSQYWNLSFSRRSIGLYAEQNGKFPDSLDEFNQYGSKFPNKIYWYCHPKDLITENSAEHSVLDGTGGLYYDPNNGNLKLNLTKPLKSYWIFYFGIKRNDVPADW
jgi:hypothetical protein